MFFLKYVLYSFYLVLLCNFEVDIVFRYKDIYIYIHNCKNYNWQLFNTEGHINTEVL